ncbi:hypothetical protein RJ641_004958 [Dillenia turbinata]|uniref:PHD-type domain-containing protein n=1 Tax=Dillenia turbinata TaxID=194707 RepID=A0AAN8VJD4_9MAGN
MAFHVACPITCRRICYCKLGFPQKLQTKKARDGFLEEISTVEEFLKDPWLLRVRERSTVQVLVPKVVTTPASLSVNDGFGVGDAEELLSAQTKRAAIQKRAAAASLVAEDYARRFESGDLADPSKLLGEEQGQSSANVMCRICFVGEIQGSERSTKMLSCKSCSKKYHRSCIKSWAQNRDLFHWSSWTCPSCRICEACRRTGDPTKFMFCKRCDGAYHCYCLQPKHKNVSSGPYLCPKHTRCHSCNSTVPGNGLSTRWFLGYTCCDACGRLFVKGNYCPVCLKVYRDSESTPMVCCDVCQRWVHCECDGISDERYLQFQVDGNLYYKCPTCRGECYQVKDLEDAVRELWMRRDKADQPLIATLRAEAGLPTDEEIFSISPYSDDEEAGPIKLKNEYGRSLKFSLKGTVEKSSKKTKEYGKKSSNKKTVKKKVFQTSLINKTETQNFEGHHDAQSFGPDLGDEKINEMESLKSERLEVSASTFPGSVNCDEGVCSINQPGLVKHKFIDEVSLSNENKGSRIVKIKSSKPHAMDIGEDAEKHASKSKSMKGTKLVIHLGARNRNITSSPMSDASSCQKEQEVTTSNGSGDTSHQKINDKRMEDRHKGAAKYGDGSGGKVDHPDQSKGLKLKERDGNLIKLGKLKQENSVDLKSGRVNSTEGYGVTPGNAHIMGRSAEGSRADVRPVPETSGLRGEESPVKMQPEGRAGIFGQSNEKSSLAPASNSHLKDSKPLLKLKFKNPYMENQSSWIPLGEEEKSLVKGQRSKRKRPSPSRERPLFREDDYANPAHTGNSMNDVMDAKILKKLGRDAVGKRVEVHQPSDNSWHKGVVTDLVEGTTLFVELEDGRSKTLELGKHGVRFVSETPKRLRT